MWLLLTALACGGNGGDSDTDRSGSDTACNDAECAPTGAAAFRSVEAACDADAWRYVAETDAWTREVTVVVSEDVEAPRVEAHTLEVTRYGEWGDHLERTLTIGDETAFACDGGTRVAMMWLWRAWDTDGELSDCIVAGASPEKFFDETAPQYVLGADPTLCRALE